MRRGDRTKQEVDGDTKNKPWMPTKMTSNDHCWHWHQKFDDERHQRGGRVAQEPVRKDGLNQEGILAAHGNRLATESCFCAVLVFACVCIECIRLS